MLRGLLKAVIRFVLNNCGGKWIDRASLADDNAQLRKDNAALRVLVDKFNSAIVSLRPALEAQTAACPNAYLNADGPS
ncbi:MAG: hypothetical protein AAF449_09445 [Myxococcota bacterium]